MFGFIIMMLVISSMMKNPTGTKRMLRNLFTFIAVVYGIRFILFAGFHLLPLIIIIWAVTNIGVPFFRGFFSSFQKNRTQT